MELKKISIFVLFYKYIADTILQIRSHFLARKLANNVTNKKKSQYNEWETLLSYLPLPIYLPLGFGDIILLFSSSYQTWFQ